MMYEELIMNKKQNYNNNAQYNCNVCVKQQWRVKKQEEVAHEECVCE